MSGYLEHLPAVLRQGPFLGQFLLAFEQILGEGTGIEGVLDTLHCFFDPDEAPPDFLPWLAQWVGISLRADWTEQQNRAFLRRIVPLYRERGTRAGIEKVLRLYTKEVSVLEPGGSDPAHYFKVRVTVSDRDPGLLARRVRTVRALVDWAKPAHTFYGLVIEYPAMQINNDPVNQTQYGPGIIVGENTVLGTTQAPGDDVRRALGLSPAAAGSGHGSDQ